MDSANSDAIMGGNRTLRAQSPFEQVDHDDDDGAPPLFLFGACGETCWFTRAWNRKVQETHTDTQTGSWDSSAMWNGISHSLGTKKMFVWAMEGFDAHLIHYSKGLLFVKTFFLPVIFFSDQICSQCFISILFDLTRLFTICSFCSVSWLCGALSVYLFAFKVISVSVYCIDVHLHIFWRCVHLLLLYLWHYCYNLP